MKKILPSIGIAAVSLAAATAIAAPERIMTAVAGTGAPGYFGDGGPAKTALLNQPFHASFGADGAMFIADTMNHAIRRVDRSGKITTVAGCGRKGYTGDGGPATAATMNEPYGVVAASNGDLYIVDRLNACVRKVSGKTGIITTLAGNGTAGYGGDGGPAGKSQMREPNGLSLYRDEMLYVADVRDNRIRLVDLNTGVITTFSGTGRREFTGDGGPAAGASINGARAVDVDGDGNVYICEREGNRIRRVDRSTGTIRTIAGTGAAGYSGDGGPALQATFRGPKWVDVDERGDVYVVDTENHCVRRIDQRTGTITTAAGSGRKGPGGDGGAAAAAEMDRPHGCSSYKGLLYIADSNNHRVRSCPVPEAAPR